MIFTTEEKAKLLDMINGDIEEVQYVANEELERTGRWDLLLQSRIKLLESIKAKVEEL